MPGILPMKVIKVGTSSQSRIAQACDRCRSKKIRCDGIRPCCSQCANVGFECKTSDKLSRRAFPRGYTESLEERVRQLEAEVRELKDLLDEKDEKIDMLSKMHGNRRQSTCAHLASNGSSPSAPDSSNKALGTAPPPKEDTFRVQASPLLLGVENSDSYFMGASSGRAFIETFKRKLQESGKSCPDFNPEAFLHIQGCYPLTANAPPRATRVPPRLFSDRCVNIYFQEWAPLFPVLHKPTFLRIYEEFVADPDKVKNNHKLGQLYLVFSIAALSSELPDVEQIAICEQQWQRALEPIAMDNTIITLQCLVLALMYCTVRADYKRLQHYKGIAVVLSHRLGLHQSQKRFSFGALTIETRKKVFWTLYTLDCFSAAVLGLPKLMKEEDIQAEYPSDTDDEYVTEKGFQPTLPGEYTKLSSALALFRGARILAKVLEKIYPAAASHELSLQQMLALDAELQKWSDELPAHLKLTFAQDKPSTDVTGSRSPLLALTYYCIRTLIFRPAIGSSLGQKAAPALINVCDSAKHIIQIVQLLEERSMSFSFCLNKADVVVLCGMSLLYQSLELKQESKMLKDSERLVNGVVKILEKSSAPGTYDFKRVAGMLVTVEQQQQPAATSSGRRSMDSVSSTSSATSAPPAAPSQRASPPTAAPKKKLPISLGRHASASVSETDLLQQQEKLRRVTMPSIPNGRPELYRSQSRPSFDGVKGEPPMMAVQMPKRPSPKPSAISQSLDYLSLSSTPRHTHPSSPMQHCVKQQAPAATQSQQGPLYTPTHINTKVPGVSAQEWESLLGSMDGGAINVYDAIYGGPALPLEETPVSSTSNYSGWSPDSWDLAAVNLNSATDFSSTTPPGGPQSVLSLSDESLSSGDEMAPNDHLDLGPLAGVSGIDFRGQMIPAACGPADGTFILDGLDGNFTL